MNSSQRSTTDHPGLLLCNSLHTPVGQFVKLNNSFLFNSKDLIWAVCAVLPVWVKPPIGISHMLGIKSEPLLTEVIDNIRNVCANLKEKKIISQIMSDTLIEYITRAFNYLGDHRDLKDDMLDLKEIQCVPVNGGSGLVNPYQITCQNTKQKLKKTLLHICINYHKNFTSLRNFWWVPWSYRVGYS